MKRPLGDEKEVGSFWACADLHGVRTDMGDELFRMGR